MPSYNPQPFVRVNGVTWSGSTIANVQITQGRPNINQQQRAGYANISIVTADDQTYPQFDIEDLVEVGVLDTSLNEKLLFTGRISDNARILLRKGETGYLTENKITAVGILSRVNRQLVCAGGYAQELDGIRVKNIIGEAVGITYATFNDFFTPGTYDSLTTETYATLDPYLDNFDDGSYEIRTYSTGATNAYNLASTVANSGRGVLYETADGRVGYRDNQSRVNETNYIDITGEVILAEGLQTNTRIADVANAISVKYATSSTVSDENQASIDQYGKLNATVETLLADITAANALLDYYLNTRSLPQKSLERITVGLHLDDMSNTLRDDLLDVYLGTAIQTDDLPASIFPYKFEGFVEGWVWVITRNTMFLTLVVSEYNMSILAQNWSQVDAAEAWNTISATLEWQEARVVT
jgi:hypothetical protein